MPPQDANPTPSFGGFGFRDGRYMVKEALGEGSTKRVYLVRDTLLDREVAFAVIKTERLDDTGRRRVLREAQTMGKLGDHPNVVQIYDFGDEGGQPYMVLPLLNGGHLEGLIRNGPEQGLPIDRCVSLARDVCEGLAYAHSMGFVHRDVKPSNIWLNGNGTAKIGDFGLAIALDRSRLTRENMLVGTVWYMSPEQSMGGDVNRRSDIYSLGCVLYQMVTGRPPFVGDDPVAILGQHINTPCVPPTRHRPDCPKDLEALILRMVAKDPAERPDSAADVLYALDALGDSSGGGKSEQLEPHEHGPSPERVEATAFIGRQREMGVLKQLLEDAIAGKGRVALLVGEPGVGKTRTAKELATYAGMRGVQVLRSRCYDQGGMPPFSPWVQAIRSYAGQVDAERLRLDLGQGAADIAEIVPGLRHRLSDIEPLAPAASPTQARARLFESATGFLRNVADGQPLLLIIDNLHLADASTLRLLQWAARDLRDAPLMVLGTYGDALPSDDDLLTRTLGDLDNEQLSREVLLSNLDEEGVARLAELTAGAFLPEGVVAALLEVTGGNPRFLTEAVRLLAQDGRLDGEGWKTDATGSDSGSLRIPSDVDSVLIERVARCSSALRETLSVAAIVGREFEGGHLLKLVPDLSKSGLLEVIEEGRAAGVIEKLPGPRGRYQFSSRAMRDTLVSQVPESLRMKLHFRAGEMLEDVYGPESETHASELAHHFARAEVSDGGTKLVWYSLMASERALTVYAYEDAIDHLETALAAKQGMPQDVESTALRRALDRAREAATA